MKRTNFTKIIKADGVSGAEILINSAKNKTHTFLYPTCEIKKNGYVIVDFGKELCGRLHMAFGGCNCENASVRVRLGESVYETCAEIGEKNAGNYHSLRDNRYSVVSWGDVSTSESGFRFARIDNVGCEIVKLALIYAEESENGLTIKSDFSCSDEQLNEIYKTAERTLSLCVREDDIWDGIKRDRVSWIGDFYPELLGAYTLYGNIPQFEKVLDCIKYFDGHWVNDIPSYSAWWIICLEKYFDLSDNGEYVKSVISYVDKIVGDYSDIIGENGAVSYENNKLAYFGGNEFFFDWPTNGQKDSEIGWRYLVLYAMKCASKLFARFGGDTKKAGDIIESLDKYDYKPSEFKQVTALGVLAGKISADSAKENLMKGGAKGMTSFMSFAIIEALRMVGEGEFALSVIKEYFGSMMNLGATTFWEDFDMEWLKDNPTDLEAMPDGARKNIHADYGKFCYLGLRHSLCHGWSCGFVDFLYKHILGIVPVKEGYAEITVDPHMCGMSFVEGKIPTEYGVIRVKHKVVDGKIETTLELPDGITKK